MATGIDKKAQALDIVSRSNSTPPLPVSSNGYGDNDSDPDNDHSSLPPTFQLKPGDQLPQVGHTLSLWLRSTEGDLSMRLAATGSAATLRSWDNVKANLGSSSSISRWTHMQRADAVAEIDELERIAMNESIVRQKLTPELNADPDRYAAAEIQDPSMSCTDEAEHTTYPASLDFQVESESSSTDISRVARRSHRREHIPHNDVLRLKGSQNDDQKAKR